MSAVLDTYCKLTCRGGSERGKCPCAHPRDCQVRSHPDFENAREDASAHMFREVLEPDVHLRKPADPLLSSSEAYDLCWVAQCGWNAREHRSDEGSKYLYRDLTTADVSAVTCRACIEAAIKFGDAARDRFLELERAAGEAESEVSA